MSCKEVRVRLKKSGIWSRESYSLSFGLYEYEQEQSRVFVCILYSWSSHLQCNCVYVCV